VQPADDRRRRAGGRKYAVPGENLGLMMRATTSVPPPGGKPTTMRTGLVG
jgi:hypothetical protein